MQLQNMKPYSSRPLAVAIISLSILFHSSSSQAQTSALAQKYDALINMITYAYVDSVDQEKISDDAIRHLLKELDPHTVYIPGE